MRLGVFIDGTFIPERDGASTRFAKMPRHLADQGTDIVVFHCYRGWSDLARISSEPFRTYFFPPEVFYNDLDCVTRIARDERLDIIQMNDAETVQRIGYPLADALDLRVVYEAHYHTSTLATALDAPPSRIEALKTLEADMAKHVDHLIVFTEADRQRWVSLSEFPKSRISVVPFGVEAVVAESAATKRHSIVFLGNLFYEPNRRAVQRIVSEILPIVRSLRPCTQAVIVGDIPTDLREQCVAADIEVTGEVADPLPWLLEAAVGLAPVSEGSGIRAKILQYLGAGVPVVATEPAAEGLTLPSVFLENSSQAAALRCVDILERPSHYEFVVRQTGTILRRGLLWRDIAHVATGVYSNLMNSPPLRRPSANLLSPDLPMWIQEVFRNGRFIDADTSPLGSYRFGVAGRGEFKTFS